MRKIGLKCVLAGVIPFILGSCNDEEVLYSTESREITALDRRPVLLEPSSKDRFEVPDDLKTPEEKAAAVASTLAYELPANWKEKESTMFREINMEIIEGGEVYLSRVGGSLLDNANRWYGQFKLPKVTEDVLKAGETVSLLGETGYIITAEGSYNAGMGKPPQENVMLIGVISESKNGLTTVKLIAPIEVAKKQLPALKAFCASVKSN